MDKQTNNNNQHSLQFLKGFTLSEVLLVLSIIGVIAALTIPSLIGDIGDTQTRVAWKKEYSALSQATRKMAADNGGSLSGLFADTNGVLTAFGNYFNFVKTCNKGSAAGTNNCWPYTTISNLHTGTFPIGTAPSAAVLNDGALLSFGLRDGNCAFTDNQLTNICGEVYIDVNGAKAPNTLGKDVFEAYYFNNGTVKPRGTTGDNAITNPDTDCTATTGDGYGCSAKYLYD